MTTITETRAEAPAAAPPPAPSPITSLFGTADHKTIGRLYIGASLLMAVLAAVMGGLVGYERLDTNSTSLKDAFQQIYTLHSISAVFLFLIPLVLGVAFVIVPLQVGASTVAFPRAAAGSFWLWLVSAGVLLAAYGINGGPFGGDGEAVDLFLVAFGGVIVALLLATLCVVATVVALRTAGMTLDRTPMFSWSMLVAGSMWLLSLPVLFGTTIFLYVDHRNARVIFGGTNGIYLRILWVFAQPQLYAFAVPALGFAAEVVAVFTGVRARLRTVQMAMIGAVGILGFGAWTQTVGGLDGSVINAKVPDEALYGIMAFAVVIPLVGLLGAVGDAIRRGKVRVTAPLVFGVGALLLVLGGAVVGAVATIRDLDLQTPATTWMTGQAHAVLLGVSLAAVGAVHYWAPKLFGRMLNGALGLLTAALLLIGTLVLVVPDLVSGALDQPAFLTEGSVRSGVEALNAVALAGGILVTLGLLLFIVNLFGAASRRHAGAPDDPWGGQTLEWATSSPPHPGNFAGLEDVVSPEPLLDRAAAAAAEED
jgi:heme/copper-type cytochrome/quinol oxidase subunit 1